MRVLTQGLLFFGYVFLAMTAGAFVWRAGLGAGAGAAAGIASLGLLATLHTWLSGKAERAALKKEIDQVREAHRLLADAMESTQGALTELAQAIETGALSSTEQLSGEVRMLESLIQQMSESIDQRISQPTPINTFEARHRAQSDVLLQTIHEALAENRVDLYLQPIVSLPQRRSSSRQ